MNQRRAGDEQHKREKQVEAKYCNYFEVAQNEHEFIVGCGQVYEDGEFPSMHTRIIMVPRYAKALLRTLAESLVRHEHDFGPIDES